ncbi:jg18498 [Pararge aegeria aegeria]|uniref:Jg18498 protein n=3 Tax=Pararge aegeria TaxID=116150 RepID=A0A8S4RP72_9NEOP|nr:jg18498 [Pararge aegeria aegeria]
MGRMSGIKWERASQCRPVHNIISSDFPKYNPQPWKFMEGRSQIQWILSYEYQRMWLDEREAWKKRMYPENTTVNVDIVKRYVLTFKTNHHPPKQEQKLPFKIKK